eukprot:m.306111 g.306111  ORF g.306111 m.306111 type:complete len:656 (-) comp55304_c0_seq4:2893-4860(-)
MSTDVQTGSGYQRSSSDESPAAPRPSLGALRRSSSNSSVGPRPGMLARQSGLLKLPLPSSEEPSIPEDPTVATVAATKPRPGMLKRASGMSKALLSISKRGSTEETEDDEETSQNVRALESRLSALSMVLKKNSEQSDANDSPPGPRTSVAETRKFNISSTISSTSVDNSAASESLVITYGLTHMHSTNPADVHLGCLITLAVPERPLHQRAPDQTNRSPLDLVAIVDLSLDARQDGVYVLLIESVKAITARMRIHDRLCLVVMNDDGIKTMPFTLMNPRGKKAAELFLVNLIPSGAPKIAQALEAASTIFIANTITNAVCCLFSNGGFQSDKEDVTLLLAEDTMLSLSMPVHTVALGMSPQIEPLSRLAMTTGGALHEIPVFADLAEVATNIVGIQYAVAVPDVQVDVRAAMESVSILAFDSPYSKQDHDDLRGFRFSLPDWKHAESRVLGVVTLCVPRQSAETSLELLSTTLTYELPSVEEPITIVKVLVQPASILSTEPVPISMEVEKELNLRRCISALKAAHACVQKQDFPQARSFLDEAEKSLAASAIASEQCGVEYAHYFTLFKAHMQLQVFETSVIRHHRTATLAIPEDRSRSHRSLSPRLPRKSALVGIPENEEADARRTSSFSPLTSPRTQRRSIGKSASIPLRLP